MRKLSTTPNPVLYVEDEENDVFLMQLAFERAGRPAPLVVVSDGAEAVNYLSGNGHPGGARPDCLPCLVLLDLNLPMMSGFEVLCWIRSQPALKALPVVIFSSSGQPKDKERAQELGASDYLVKPLDMGRLDDTVRQLVERWLKQTKG